MLKKIMCLSLIAILAISSIGVCSAHNGDVWVKIDDGLLHDCKIILTYDNGIKIDSGTFSNNGWGNDIHYGVQSIEHLYRFQIGMQTGYGGWLRHDIKVDHWYYLFDKDYQAKFIDRGDIVARPLHDFFKEQFQDEVNGGYRYHWLGYMESNNRFDDKTLNYIL